MRSIKLLFLLTGIVLLTMACAAHDLPQTQPVNTPTELPTQAPIRIPPPTQTPPPIFLPSTPEITPFPAWVTNFSDPILTSLVGRRPEFQDEFSPLNRGWFYDVGGRPYYAHISDGALILELPEGNERSDLMVYSPALSRRDFVLSFDLRFGETQPDDYLEFQFTPTAGQSFALDLSKDKNWDFRWKFQNDWKSITGTYDQFPPELINVVFMVQGNECAVYLNHTPLDYSDSCRIDLKYRLSQRAVSFHVIAVPGHTAIATIDNVMMWDLDAAPFFPNHP